MQYGDFYQPMVPVTFIVGEQQLSYEALVDTGADHSVIHLELAKILGVKLQSSRQVEVLGVGGSTTGYIATTDLELGGFSMKQVPIIFADLGDKSFGILGHAGLFDRLRLVFEFGKHEFEISPKTYR